MNHNGPADLILFTLSWVNRTTKSQVFKHLIQATNGTKNLYSLPPPYPVWQAERHVSTKGLSALTSKVGRNELEKARRCNTVSLHTCFFRMGFPSETQHPGPGVLPYPVNVSSQVGPWFPCCLSPPLSCLRPGTASSSSPPAALPHTGSGGQKVAANVSPAKGMRHPLKECGTHSQW